MIDRYIWGDCSRISPEAPVPVLNVEKETSVLGGAGNVVSNLVSLGADVHVIGIVGNDFAADSLQVLIKKERVSSNLIVDCSKRTTVKTRLMASNHQMLRFDEESSQTVSESVAAQVLFHFKKNIDNCDIVLISDYGKGFLTDALTQSLISISNHRQKRVLVDPKGADFSKYKGAFLLTPNKQEASVATGIDIIDNGTLLRALRRLKADCDLKVSLITLSENGIAVLDDELRLHPTIARKVYDVTGAGDTVLAALGFALSAGVLLSEAIVFANYAAAVVVAKIGSSSVTIEEISELHRLTVTKLDATKVLSVSEMNLMASGLKGKGKSIVFTSGCFDILSVGCVRYLQKAKSYGDVLVVGVSSDQSARDSEGSGRPVNGAEDRALTLSALDSVDFVVIFDDEPLYDLIRSMRPDVLVRGDGYKNTPVIGQDLVDDVRIIDFL